LSVSRHAGYNLVGSIIPIALSLVTVPIYLGLVGAERYGVLAIAWVLLGYFGLFDLGLGRATSFRIASLRDAPSQARSDAFFAALAVNVLMGGVGALVLWFVSTQFFGQVFKVGEHLRPEIVRAMPLLAASVPVATLTGVLTGAVQGRERFLEINIVSATSTALFQLFPLLIAWKIGPDLTYLLAGALCARILALLVLGYRCYVELVRGHAVRFDRREVVTLMKYGGWVNLTSIFAPILSISDRLMVGVLLGAAAVASYTVPVQLAGRLAILPSALTTALFPRLSAVTPEQRRALCDKAMLTLAALLGAPFVGGVFLVGPFLAIWVGDKIGPESALVGRIMVAAMFANGLALISFVHLQASGRPDRVTFIQIIEIPPYLLLLYLGSKFLGLPGNALATAARYVGDFAILTLAAGAPPRNWRLVGLYLALLALAVWLAGLWPITDWRWWASAFVLVSAAGALGLRTIPPDIRASLVGRAAALVGRS
jgi:O-antigen/teichoic acid export membrane protein